MGCVCIFAYPLDLCLVYLPTFTTKHHVGKFTSPWILREIYNVIYIYTYRE